MSKVDILRRSKLIQTRIINSSEFRTAKVIAAYFAIGSEVRTDYIMKSAFKNHKVLVLPKTEGDQIVFHKIFELDFERKKLTKDKFGIYGPPGSSDSVDNIDLLIVPGIAFDSNGYRLGYGKGYYDKFIEKNKSRFSIGLAFRFQLLNFELPHSNFDQKLDAVATEKKMLVFQDLNAS